MKTKHLPIACLALAVTFSATAQDNSEKPKPTRSSSSTSSHVVTKNGKTDGRVTVTVNKDGNVQTQTWKIGDPTAATTIRMVPTQKKEKVTWLGIAMTQVSDDVATQLPIPKGAGLRVRHILPNSPASKSDLATDDLLYMLDDQILFNEPQVQGLIRSKKPGNPVKLTYFRKGEKRTATAKLSEHEMFVVTPPPRIPSVNGSGTDPVINSSHFRALLGGSGSLTQLPSGPRTQAVVVDPFGQARVMEHRNINEQLSQQLNSVRQQLREQLEKSGMAKKELERALKTMDEALKQSKTSTTRIRTIRANGDPF
jgi:hypothetical protein